MSPLTVISSVRPICHPDEYASFSFIGRTRTQTNRHLFYATLFSIHARCQIFTLGHSSNPWRQMESTTQSSCLVLSMYTNTRGRLLFSHRELHSIEHEHQKVTILLDCPIYETYRYVHTSLILGGARKKKICGGMVTKHKNRQKGSLGVLFQCSFLLVAWLRLYLTCG